MGVVDSAGSAVCLEIFCVGVSTTMGMGVVDPAGSAVCLEIVCGGELGVHTR